MRTVRRVLITTVAVVGVVGVAAWPAAAADVTPFTVSPPSVTGPIPSTATNFPYIADGFGPQPPVPRGYVEKEYFVSGTGNIYEYTPTGIQVVSPCPASTGSATCKGIPYTTRMLVKMPSNPRKFSGTVVVEPLNPSGGFDIAAVWDRSWQYFVRHGDIFVGWTSRAVAMNALKTFNPTRYASLNFGNNTAATDGITFDVAAQIGALFKSDDHGKGHDHGNGHDHGRGKVRGKGNNADSLTRGLHVKHVFEAGFSQDGGFTFTQADVFNALERMPGGGPIYDGYVPGGTGGPSNIDFGLTPAGALPANDPRHQMQPRDVPVIHINTETEEALGAPGGLPYRRPDSDAPGDRYRLWEVPGASHVSNDFGGGMPITLQLNLAELQGIPPSQLAPVGCAHQQFINGPSMGVPGVIDPNDYPFKNVANAAFADLLNWVNHGPPPPHANPIAVSGGAIQRDAFGNALGGVRTPFVDVPITTYSPTDTVAHPTAFSGFCVLYGYNTPFSPATLAALYRNHGQYVAKVARESLQLVHEGFWLRPDAIDVIRAAAHADVPQAPGMGSDRRAGPKDRPPGPGHGHRP
jgi:hypothetical protein